jgi:hypothetical protein
MLDTLSDARPSSAVPSLPFCFLGLGGGEREPVADLFPTSVIGVKADMARTCRYVSF